MKVRLQHCLWAVLLSGLPLLAQTTGTIVGRVSDPAKAAVPNAQIELINESTGVAVTAAPTAEGDFTFPRLTPGSYQLKVSAEGFTAQVRRNIGILVNQTARIDVELAVGTVSASIDVSGAAPIVQSETSSVGNVVDGHQVEAMPLNGRTSIYGLMAMAPGVQQAGSNPAIAGSGLSRRHRPDHRRRVQ